jgi:hypothetical protein
MKILSKKIKLTGRIKYTKENHEIIYYIKRQFTPFHKMLFQNLIFFIINNNDSYDSYGYCFEYDWEEEQRDEIWSGTFKYLIK